MDCNLTENFLKEMRRICEATEHCDNCPLAGDCLTCTDNFQFRDMIETVQKWSDGHPQKSYLEVALETFPHLRFEDGARKKPVVCRAQLFGGMCEFDRECADCWNQPFEAED